MKDVGQSNWQAFSLSFPAENNRLYLLSLYIRAGCGRCDGAIELTAADKNRVEDQAFGRRSSVPNLIPTHVPGPISPPLSLDPSPASHLHRSLLSRRRYEPLLRNSSLWVFSAQHESEKRSSSAGDLLAPPALLCRSRVFFSNNGTRKDLSTSSG